MAKLCLPKTGKTGQDGTIVQWLKMEGDSVRKGETLFRFETEEGLAEAEAAADGTLRTILLPVGGTAPFGAPVAVLQEEGEDVAGLVLSSASEASSQAGKPASLGPVSPILMPQAGQSMEEGTILSWKVKPGDRVKVGDIIMEIETDKANIEIEAVDEGRLARIVVPEGELVPVKTPVAYLAENDSDVDAYLASAEAAAAGRAETRESEELRAGKLGPRVAPPVPAVISPQAGKPAPRETGRVKASPAARKLARERRVDLAGIGAGSGPGGRILSTDVAAAASTAPSGSTRRRMSSMRRAIARSLVASKQSIPHFYMRLTIDADPLHSAYRAEKAKYSVSVNDWIVLACARAMQEFPSFRSRLDGEDIVEAPTSNVGIAVGMDDGLVVPVVIGAERLPLERLAAETRRLVEAARKGKVEGMGQGGLTISNLGMFGVEEFAAIINPPEAAILAVGAIREAVIVKDGAMQPGRVMTMTLSCDHRLVDGLLAARFLAQVKALLEAPGKLI